MTLQSTLSAASAFALRWAGSPPLPAPVRARLAVFMDLFHRKVVGWSMATRITRSLVLDAFNMAFANCYPNQGLIVHSDRGSQYASDDFTKKLKKLGFKQSMSLKGDCWDNAVAESFFGSLKTELIHNKKYATIAQARRDIFDYV